MNMQNRTVKKKLLQSHCGTFACSSCFLVRPNLFAVSGLRSERGTLMKPCSQSGSAAVCGEIDCLYILLMICPLPSVLVRRKAGQHPQGRLTHISVSYYIRIAILSLLFIASFSTTEESQYSETSCTTNFLCSSVIF